jgi:hypothetical protein
MKTNNQKLIYGGLISSLLLYYLGIVMIVSLRSVGRWRGPQIIYEVTGVKAVLIGLFMVIISFIFYNAFIKDLKKYISEHNKFFNFKSLYLLLLLFYILTPLLYIHYLYINMPRVIKFVFFAAYIIYLIYMFIKFYFMYKYLTAKSETQ